MLREVAGEELVGGDDDSGGRDGGKVFFAARTFQREAGEIGGETGGFGMPVDQEGFGADDEGRAVRPLAAQGGEEAEALQGFPKTHFIGENTAVAVRSVIEEPLNSGFLVVAQDGQESRRDAGIERPDRRGG